MKFLLAFFALTSLATTACANPEYIQANQNVKAEQNNDCLVPFTKLGVCGTFQWQNLPKNQTYTTFSLAFNNANIKSEHLKVYLWMPSMGHGSAPVSIIDLGNGQFNIEQVYFVMPGAWEIRFEISLDGITDSYYHPLMIAR